MLAPTAKVDTSVLTMIYFCVLGLTYFDASQLSRSSFLGFIHIRKVVSIFESNGENEIYFIAKETEKIRNYHKYII